MGVTGTPSCSYTGNGWEILNAFANDADFATPSSLSFTLGTGTNPDSEQSAGSWSVTTQNDVGGTYYTVDEGTSTTSFTTTIGAISPSATDPILSTSYVTGDKTAVYTFSFTTEHNIPSNGYVEFTFPGSNVLSLISTSTCVYQTTPSSCSAVGSTGVRITITAGHLATNNPLKV